MVFKASRPLQAENRLNESNVQTNHTFAVLNIRRMGAVVNQAKVLRG
jgi:hypothetical protein